MLDSLKMFFKKEISLLSVAKATSSIHQLLSVLQQDLENPNSKNDMIDALIALLQKEKEVPVNQ